MDVVVAISVGFAGLATKDGHHVKEVEFIDSFIGIFHVVLVAKSCFLVLKRECAFCCKVPQDGTK